VVGRAAERYELAAILARGSAAATLAGIRWRVPVVRGVTAVPAGVEAAFAAMGPEGEEAVLELLHRGVHVLCEHPVGAAFVARALEAARQSGAVFHVNAHFPMLSAPRAFIARCAERTGEERPAYVQAALTPRLLYALCDILHHAGLAGAVELQRVPRSGGSFRTLTGTIGGVAATLEVEPLRPDGSAENVVDCRITVGFRGDVLTLPGLGACGEPMARERFDEERLRAIGASMDALVGQARGGAVPAGQTPEHLLSVSRAADAAFRALA